MTTSYSRCPANGGMVTSTFLDCGIRPVAPGPAVPTSILWLALTGIAVKTAGNTALRCEKTAGLVSVS